MDLDELDIYDDLDDFQKAEEKKISDSQYKELEIKYEESVKTIESLKLEIKDLKKKNKQIQINFQNLLETAKAEIKRKDQLLNEVRKEKDDICFRRKFPKPAGGHQQQQQQQQKQWQREDSAEYANPFKQKEDTTKTTAASLTAEYGKVPNLVVGNQEQTAGSSNRRLPERESRKRDRSREAEVRQRHDSHEHEGRQRHGAREVEGRQQYRSRDLRQHKNDDVNDRCYKSDGHQRGKPNFAEKDEHSSSSSSKDYKHQRSHDRNERDGRARDRQQEKSREGRDRHANENRQKSKEEKQRNSREEYYTKKSACNDKDRETSTTMKREKGKEGECESSLNQIKSRSSSKEGDCDTNVKKSAYAKKMSSSEQPKNNSNSGDEKMQQLELISCTTLMKTSTAFDGIRKADESLATATERSSLKTESATATKVLDDFKIPKPNENIKATATTSETSSSVNNKESTKCKKAVQQGGLLLKSAEVATERTKLFDAIFDSSTSDGSSTNNLILTTSPESFCNKPQQKAESAKVINKVCYDLTSDTDENENAEKSQKSGINDQQAKHKSSTMPLSTPKNAKRAKLYNAIFGTPSSAESVSEQQRLEAQNLKTANTVASSSDSPSTPGSNINENTQPVEEIRLTYAEVDKYFIDNKKAEQKEKPIENTNTKNKCSSFKKNTNVEFLLAHEHEIIEVDIDICNTDTDEKLEALQVSINAASDNTAMVAIKPKPSMLELSLDLIDSPEKTNFTIEKMSKKDDNQQQQQQSELKQKPAVIDLSLELIDSPEKLYNSTENINVTMEEKSKQDYQQQQQQTISLNSKLQMKDAPIAMTYLGATEKTQQKEQKSITVKKLLDAPEEKPIDSTKEKSVDTSEVKQIDSSENKLFDSLVEIIHSPLEQTNPTHKAAELKPHLFNYDSDDDADTDEYDAVNSQLNLQINKRSPIEILENIRIPNIYEVRMNARLNLAQKMLKDKKKKISAIKEYIVDSIDITDDDNGSKLPQNKKNSNSIASVANVEENKVNGVAQSQEQEQYKSMIKEVESDVKVNNTGETEPYVDSRLINVKEIRPEVQAKQSKINEEEAQGIEREDGVKGINFEEDKENPKEAHVENAEIEKENQSKEKFCQMEENVKYEMKSKANECKIQAEKRATQAEERENQAEEKETQEEKEIQVEEREKQAEEQEIRTKEQEIPAEEQEIQTKEQKNQVENAKEMQGNQPKSEILARQILAEERVTKKREREIDEIQLKLSTVQQKEKAIKSKLTEILIQVSANHIEAQREIEADDERATQVKENKESLSKQRVMETKKKEAHQAKEIEHEVAEVENANKTHKEATQAKVRETQEKIRENQTNIRETLEQLTEIKTQLRKSDTKKTKLQKKSIEKEKRETEIQASLKTLGQADLSEIQRIARDATAAKREIHEAHLTQREPQTTAIKDTAKEKGTPERDMQVNEKQAEEKQKKSKMQANEAAEKIEIDVKEMQAAKKETQIKSNTAKIQRRRESLDIRKHSKIEEKDDQAQSVKDIRQSKVQEKEMQAAEKETQKKPNTSKIQKRRESIDIGIYSRKQEREESQAQANEKATQLKPSTSNKIQKRRESLVIRKYSKMQERAAKDENKNAQLEERKSQSNAHAIIGRKRKAHVEKIENKEFILKQHEIPERDACEESKSQAKKINAVGTLKQTAVLPQSGVRKLSLDGAESFNSKIDKPNIVHSISASLAKYKIPKISKTAKLEERSKTSEHACEDVTENDEKNKMAKKETLKESNVEKHAIEVKQKFDNIKKRIENVEENDESLSLSTNKKLQHASSNSAIPSSPLTISMSANFYNSDEEEDVVAAAAATDTQVDNALETAILQLRELQNNTRKIPIINTTSNSDNAVEFILNNVSFNGDQKQQTAAVVIAGETSKNNTHTAKIEHNIEIKTVHRKRKTTDTNVTEIEVENFEKLNGNEVKLQDDDKHVKSLFENNVEKAITNENVHCFEDNNAVKSIRIDCNQNVQVVKPKKPNLCQENVVKNATKVILNAVHIAKIKKKDVRLTANTKKIAQSAVVRIPTIHKSSMQKHRIHKSKTPKRKRRILDTSSDEDNLAVQINTKSALSMHHSATLVEQPAVKRVAYAQNEDSKDSLNNSLMRLSSDLTSDTNTSVHELLQTKIQQTAAMPAAYQSPQDEKFRHLDSDLYLIFQSPEHKLNVSTPNKFDDFSVSQSPPTTSAHAATEITATNVTIEETANVSKLLQQSTDNSMNESNVSMETKHMSLGSSDYRFERVNENVVNLFISRKRRRRDVIKK